MKTIALFAAGALSLALAPVTQAQVTINITGSTAFRSVTHQAIINTLSGATAAWEGTGTAIGSSNKASFKGTIAGVGAATVNCNWNGSVEGMTIVGAGNATSGWIDPATAVYASTGNGTFGNRYAVGAAPKTSLVPTVACSDVYQASTTVTASLEDVIGGVIPFRWVVSESAPNTFTNMTDQLHELLWSSGVQPLSLFTGDAADTRQVYAVGRDAGSGTRVTRLSETRYGITKPVTQWRVTNSGGVATVFRLWPSQVEEPTPPSGMFNDATLLGNGGYTSGSSLASILGSTSTSVEIRDASNGLLASGQSVVAVGHLGLGDADVAINTNGAKSLTYNGMSYSAANVRTGKYTAWGYLHVLNQTGALSANQILARDAIVNAFGTSLLPFGATVEAGIDVNTMAVSRSEDGGLVGP
jgi:hypothetical protein